MLRIITGKGDHSIGNVPVIKNYVMDHLGDKGYTFKEEEGNSGVIQVDLSYNRKTSSIPGHPDWKREGESSTAVQQPYPSGATGQASGSPSKRKIGEWETVEPKKKALGKNKKHGDKENLPENETRRRKSEEENSKKKKK
ncbi:hypothetical protein EGW08_021628 [Elysia chlorotica]|uniref:Smr domain-containing protein n=1 Tax=Elysia chlorotica TaxID=188477 RepID=A0A3S1B2X1_ELYCH|nr:hypothetical protein EGW08_021628 [Elysia chlorotica]